MDIQKVTNAALSNADTVGELCQIALLMIPCLNQAQQKKQLTWVAAIIMSPFLGVLRLLKTLMSVAASARASSVCGTCTFISSPSKSALYGVHTHSLKRNVLRPNMRHGVCTLCMALTHVRWSNIMRMQDLRTRADEAVQSEKQNEQHQHG